VKGNSVPQANWYSCNPASCGNSPNTTTALSPDYNPGDGVELASGMTAFTAGPIVLESGESTIVFLAGAGSIQLADVGKAFTFGVTAGKASAVQSVMVVLQDAASVVNVPTVQFEVSNPTWRWTSNNDSTLRVTVRNVGEYVMHLTGVRIGDERYGSTVLLPYSASVNPWESHLVSLDTSGIAKAEMMGLAYPFTVITSEGATQLGSVSLLSNS
jgi:hypothetical protein